MVAAKHVNDDIIHPPAGISNISEWCKKEQCWTRIQETLSALEAQLDERFFDDLTSLEELKGERKDASATQKIDNGIEAQKKIFAVSAGDWTNIFEFLTRRRALTPKETGILRIAMQIPAKIPTEKQCLVLIEVLDKARNEGLIPGVREE